MTDAPSQIWAFDRYVNGVLMAEGIEITRAASFEEACVSAARLASRGPRGEVPVLVLATPAAHEAADRIEALVKERDEALEWLSASQGYIADAVFALDKQEKAEARAERLEAALREIAKPYPADQDRLIHSQQQIASIARAALKGDDHE